MQVAMLFVWNLFPIDHLPYIGSWGEPIQEKTTGLVWAFSFSEKPLQALCRGFTLS
jgi:hypothetical protein